MKIFSRIFETEHQLIEKCMRTKMVLVQTRLEDSLKDHFGYNAFRENQKEIISALLEKKDVLAILPTGAGKSICYQLPAMLMPGTAVVISPLISLMQDQVFALTKNGLPAACLNSALSFEEMNEVMQQLGSYKILYVAPERFSDKQFIERLQQVSVSIFAVDEAHCISQWGHSFRPEYRQLAFLKKTFPGSAVIALTATATREVEKDIVSQLGMQAPYTVKASFDRPNLTLRIYRKKNGSEQILSFLEKHPNQSGIIYRSTRNGVDETYEELKKAGYVIGRYHAGLSENDRTEAQHDFLYGKMPLMVATIAFGMGIHKPDIRFIIHFDMPRSIEQYYQEIGRAGRDGLPSECFMLYSAREKQIYDSFAKEIADPALRREALRKTDKMISLCTSSTCRRKALLGYFGEAFLKTPCLLCDNCLDEVEMQDETIAAQKILSCVYRLKFSFGVKHTIDVLRGLKTKLIMEQGHDRLSTFGIMTETSENKLFFLLHAMIQKGLLELTEDHPAVLRWTKTSSTVTQGAASVLIPKQTKQKAAKQDVGQNYDRILFEKLSKLRRSLADQAEVPAYVVFGDKTLIELSALLPKTQDEMMNINGVGPVKWLKYGPAFLDAIQEHVKSGHSSTPQTDQTPTGHQ
jgi:ATP-dependent DNA helicase RecQ